MQISIDWISSKYNQFNEEIFSKLPSLLPLKNTTFGSLPLPNFRLTSAKTFLGQHRKQISQTSRKEIHTLSFSIYHTHLSEKEWEDVLIHEMIHYWQSFFKITDSTPHGKIFRFLMNEINRTFQRNITISVRSSKSSSFNESDVSFVVSSRIRIHNILTLKTLSGEQCVVFMQKNKLFEWYDFLLNSGKYYDLHLYRTSDSIFNKFRHPSTLKIYICPEIEEMLCNATSIVEMQRTPKGFIPRI